MFTTLRWHRCPDCEVAWRGHDEECWSCGRMVPGSLDARPGITSGQIIQPMSDRQWSVVRRQIGVDDT